MALVIFAAVLAVPTAAAVYFIERVDRVRRREAAAQAQPAE